MSVKLIDNEAFYGFRVRRTVGGRLYQEYFSLKRSGKRLAARQTRVVERLAQARDEDLRLEQEKCKRRRKAELCFHADGRVKGISYLIKTEKSGTKTPIFHIGIASELEQRIICTSYSINAHGLQQAWAKAIRTYARHKKISRSSNLYKKLLTSMPAVELPVAERGGIESAGGGRGAASGRSGRAAVRPDAGPVMKAATTRSGSASGAGPVQTRAVRKRKAAALPSDKDPLS